MVSHNTIMNRHCRSEGEAMPLIRVDVTGPKAPEWKAAVMRGVRAGLVNGAGAPDEHVSVRVIEAPADSVDITNGRANDFIYIEVIWFEGRDATQKLAVVSIIRESLAADPGIAPTNINIAFSDFSHDDLHV